VAKIKIISNRHLNLHSESTEGGLIHVNAKQASLVPEDVKNHPQWKILTKSGTVTQLQSTSRPTDSYEFLAAKAALDKPKKKKKEKPAELEDEDALGPAESKEKSLIPQAETTGEDTVDEQEDDETEDDEDETSSTPASPSKEELIASGREFDSNGELIPTKEEWTKAGYSAKAYNDKYGNKK
jgi:hypothetical protein